MTRSREQASIATEPTSALPLRKGRPLSIYSKQTLGQGFVSLMEQRVDTLLRGLDSRVERVTVRFEDLNGPKGGVDTACRIQLTLSGRPLLIVEARAEDEAQAFRLALSRLGAALDRQRQRRAAKPRTTLRMLFARAS